MGHPDEDPSRGGLVCRSEHSRSWLPNSDDTIDAKRRVSGGRSDAGGYRTRPPDSESIESRNVTGTARRFGSIEQSRRIGIADLTSANLERRMCSRRSWEALNSSIRNPNARVDGHRIR
jgi:hypothetical protein